MNILSLPPTWRSDSVNGYIIIWELPEWLFPYRLGLAKKIVPKLSIYLSRAIFEKARGQGEKTD